MIFVNKALQDGMGKGGLVGGSGIMVHKKAHSGYLKIGVKRWNGISLGKFSRQSDYFI